MVNEEKRQTLIDRATPAYTRVPRGTPKLARLRGLLGASPGHLWPGAWPGAPRPKFAQPGPIPCPSQRAPEPPLESLGTPLSIHEAASLIGCSPWTVRQTLIPRGLPYFRSGASGRLIFYRDQIVRWIENQQGGHK
jgi:hypothetical protein